MIGGLLMALGGAALLATFLFLNVLDYSYFTDVVNPAGETIEVQLKGKEIADSDALGEVGKAGDSEEGTSLLIWTIAAGVLAVIGGLVGLIPAVARRIWVVAIPVAVVMAAWAVYSRTWLNEEVEDLSNAGSGADLSFYAAIFVFAVAIISSIVVAVRNRGTQP